jgi:hypothetical protein
MPYQEARTFAAVSLDPEERNLLQAAREDGRVSAKLGGEDDGLSRYGRLEALCSRGFLAYDGDDGLDDELEIGFVITDAGRAYIEA